MKFTKRILPTGLLILMTIFAIQAQGPDARSMDPEKKAEKQTKHLTERLSLDEEQVADIQAINLAYAEKNKAQKEAMKAERAERKAAFEKEQAAKMSEYKAVLSAEQYAELEKMHAERAEKRAAHRRGGKRKGHGGKGAGMDPEKRSGVMTTKMVDQLGLNEAQAKELRLVNLDFAKKRSAIRTKNQEEKSAHKEEMKQLKSEQQAAFEKILTKEQMEQWNAIKSEGKRAKKKGSGADGRM